MTSLLKAIRTLFPLLPLLVTCARPASPIPTGIGADPSSTGHINAVDPGYITGS
jgi:hypothetical protein